MTNDISGKGVEHLAQLAHQLTTRGVRFTATLEDDQSWTISITGF